jgi:hypothetical protein
LFKVENVHPTGSRGGNTGPRALDGQIGFGRKADLIKDAAKVPKCPPEVVASSRLRNLTPQESSEVLSREPLLGLTGQIDQEGLLLAGQRLDERGRAIEDLRLAQQAED